MSGGWDKQSYALDSLFLKPVLAKSLPKSSHCLGDIGQEWTYIPIEQMGKSGEGKGRSWHNATAYKWQGGTVNQVSLNPKHSYRCPLPSHGLFCSIQTCKHFHVNHLSNFLIV